MEQKDDLINLRVLPENVIVMSSGAFSKFIEDLGKPAEPNEALRKLMQEPSVFGE